MINNCEFHIIFKKYEVCNSINIMAESKLIQFNSIEQSIFTSHAKFCWLVVKNTEVINHF